MKPLIYGFVVFTATLVSTNASAAPCDRITLTDADDDVIIGEYSTVYQWWFEYRPISVAIPTGDVGICRRSDDGTWEMERLTCDNDTLPADGPVVETRGGDDNVAPLLREHTRFGTSQLGEIADFVYAGQDLDGEYYAFRCGQEVALRPWNPTFDFGLWVDLGEGMDSFVGSPNADRAASNFATVERVPSIPNDIWEFRAPADGAFDLLCGQGGNDRLYGDRGDSSSDWEWLDGGDGVDLCDGDFGFPNPEIDYADHCEQVEGAIEAAPGGFNVCPILADVVSRFDLHM